MLKSIVRALNPPRLEDRAVAPLDEKSVSRTTRSDVRMDGVYFFRTTASGAFSKSLEPGNYSYCVMVRAGRLQLVTDFPVAMEIELRRGDTCAVSGLTPHAFTSVGPSPQNASSRFERLPMNGNGGQSDVELIVGVAPNEALALGSLMIGPIVVRSVQHPELSRRLWRAAEMLEDEYADDSVIDRDLVIRRLAEIMLINMGRRVFAEKRIATGAGPGARANRQIMHAINAFIASPKKAWTLQALAKVAGMSRTRFAEEFKLMTGQTPAHIISRMRLTAVARELTSDVLTIEAAAEEAGYSSSAAFVRAFQREFGETPARWRRQHSPLTQSPRDADRKTDRCRPRRKGRSQKIAEKKETP
ncbi:MAG: AraC family transcriptional regulator [Rhizomicrobium sp.]